MKQYINKTVNGRSSTDCDQIVRDSIKLSRSLYNESKVRKPGMAVARMRKGYLKRRYGLSTDKYEKLLNEQGNCCKLCGLPFSEGYHPVIDYDEDLQEVRGILHRKCKDFVNFVDDDLDILESVTDYLSQPL